MKKRNRLLALGLCSLMVLPALTACGEDERVRGKVRLSFWIEVNTNNSKVIGQIVDEYNNTNQDNIYVDLKRQAAGYTSGLSSTLQGTSVPDVVQIEEKVFKGFALQGLLADIDDYITEEERDGEGDFSLSDIYPSVLNRYRVDPVTGEGGGDNALLGVPYSVSPTMIYYNKSIFNEQKVNVISYTEGSLPAGVLPHGYYVYDAAPVSGMVARPDGKYHVFNDQIAMNWEELRELSKIFTKEYNGASSSRYGYLSEWWFSYGWSVGGDCLEWDDEDQQYKFVLGDDTDNYLVTGSAGATINGTTYAESDILTFEDKKYVEAHANDPAIAGYLADQTLYPLPSTRDAFTEFVRLSQVTSKPVNNAGDRGYGISPSPTTLSNKGQTLYFTSGEVAMLSEGLDKAVTFRETMTPLGKEWGIAPLYRYVEYNADGSAKEINGTEIKGKEAGHSMTNCLSIPKNSTKKQQAAQFIKYFAGKATQSKLLDGVDAIPVNMSQISEFEAKTTSTIPNRSTVARAVAYSTPGDWSYVEDGLWINGWANILNSKVRDGDMTLEQFFGNATVIATDATLANYKSKKYSGR